MNANDNNNNNVIQINDIPDNPISLALEMQAIETAIHSLLSLPHTNPTIDGIVTPLRARWHVLAQVSRPTHNG